MAITINGTTGIAGVDGSAGTPAVQGTDTNTGIFFPAADTIAFGEGGAEVARFDSSGNLGIGTTSPASDARLTLDNGGSGAVALMFSRSGSGEQDSAIQSDAGNLIFRHGTASSTVAGITERARITSDGNLLVGTTAQIAGSTSRMVVDYATGDFVATLRNTNASPLGLYIKYSQAVNSTGSEFLYLEGTTGLRASIRSNGGIANYSANDVNLSDRREKTNFAPAKSYLDIICAIPVQTFNYINQNQEDDPGLTLGVVAQDVQEVAPELVMESDWGTKENPKMRLSIYQTDLQYALMKSIQELKAELDTTKARLAALEAK